MKVQNPLLLIGAVTIFVLMLSCLYASFLLFIQSNNVEQMRPTDENLMLTNLASVQETMLGLLTITALLSVISPLFLLHLERTLGDHLTIWKERPRASLGSILLFQPVMLFWLNTPNGLISRAIALVRYHSIESISLASNVKVFALMFVPAWTLIVTVFIFSYLKVVKAL